MLSLENIIYQHQIKKKTLFDHFLDFGLLRAAFGLTVAIIHESQALSKLTLRFGLI
jgi:uncharacterized protein YpbB